MLTLSNVSVSLLIENWVHLPENNVVEASTMASKLWITVCFALPSIGYVTDKWGKRAKVLLCASLLSIFGHALVLFWMPKLALVCIGFSFAIVFAIYWGGAWHVVHRN